MDVAFLTREDFHRKARHIGQGRGHWSTYKRRWRYHGAAVDILRENGVRDPKAVLEVGTMGITLVAGSDTLDFDERWNFKGKNPTYPHDARKVPWPVGDQQYQWAVALRVFHHLGTHQEEALLAL